MAVAGAAALKDFARYAEIVHVDPKKKAKVPKTAWNLRPGGPMKLPWGMVTSPDAGRGLALISNQTIATGENREFMRSLLKKIEADPSLMKPVSSETESIEETKTKSTESIFPTAIIEWSNAEGNVIKASVLKIDSGKVHFKMNGRVVPYDFSGLSQESQARLRELVNKSSDS